MTHSFARLNGIFNSASKHAAQVIKLFKDVFDNENRLRKLFDDEKISEADFLERRVKEAKPHMDNLHSWLLEKKQKEMILDFSKTREDWKKTSAMEY